MKEPEFRIESDILGELQVPSEAYYGVQTQRGILNYHISRKKMRDYPDYVIAIDFYLYLSSRRKKFLSN